MTTPVIQARMTGCLKFINHTQRGDWGRFHPLAPVLPWWECMSKLLKVSVSTPTEQMSPTVIHPFHSISKGQLAAYSPAAWTSISCGPLQTGLLFWCLPTSMNIWPLHSFWFCSLAVLHEHTTSGLSRWPWTFPLHSLPNSTGSKRCISRGLLSFWLTTPTFAGSKDTFWYYFYLPIKARQLLLLLPQMSHTSLVDHKPRGHLEVPDEITQPSMSVMTRICVQSQMKHENCSWELDWGWEARHCPGLSVPCHAESHILQQKENLDRW